MGPTTYDSRFPTCNTNLAACLAALRVPIKNQDPVWVVEEGEPKNGAPVKRTITFFFEEQSAPNNDGYAIEQAKHIDWAWRYRQEFEKENPEHPLIHMRRAIDKLEWLIKVKFDQITPKLVPEINCPKSTPDIILAACIMASGHALNLIDKKFVSAKFIFDLSDSEYERIIEEFECFRHGKDPVCYMRKVLECRKLLIGLVKRAPVLLHYQNGDPFAGGREGYIAKGISPEKLNQFFEFLYE